MRKTLERLSLSLDEYEAIRLADYLGMEHEEASGLMEISRSTFTRLLERARKRLASFIVEGRELHIEGGRVHFQGNLLQCVSCGHVFAFPLGKRAVRCENCGAEELVDFAGGFGHGECCDQFVTRQRKGKGKSGTIGNMVKQRRNEEV
jgi:uncharacterized protein